MKAYVINLERRTDRWSRMEQRLQAANIPFERILATTPETLPSEAVEANNQMPAGLRSSKSELACFCSHVRALEEIANGPDNHAIVLEDDAVLAKSFRTVVQNLEKSVGMESVVRLERVGERLRLQTPALPLPSGFQLFGLSEFDAGACAYLIGRKAAQSLVKRPLLNPLPFDHWLFDLQFAKPPAWQGHQLVPAIAIQERILDGVDIKNSDSDLQGLRTGRQDSFVIRGPEAGMSLVGKEYARIKRRLLGMHRRYRAGNPVFYPSRKVYLPFADDLADQSEASLNMPDPKADKPG